MPARWTLRLGAAAPQAFKETPQMPFEGFIVHLTQTHADKSVESLCGMVSADQNWGPWIPDRPMCQRCLAAMANGKNL